MKRKLKQVIEGTVSTACMGITSAVETPSILGTADYQAMSKQGMTQVVGEGGGIGGAG